MEYTKDRLDFIRRTAKDYGLDVDVVKRLYRQSTSLENFYNRLETEVKE